MNEKEYIDYLEKREEKLRKLELMVNSLQYNANDKKDNTLTLDNLKMEVFKIWYYNQYNEEYK